MSLYNFVRYCINGCIWIGIGYVVAQFNIALDKEPQMEPMERTQYFECVARERKLMLNLLEGCNGKCLEPLNKLCKNVILEP